MPNPTAGDLLKFFEVDGWIERKKSAGGSRRDRVFVRIAPDGRQLWAKVSHGRKEVSDTKLWHKIWKEELQLESEDQFWDALRTRQPVARPGVNAPPPAPPGWLIVKLTREMGFSTAQANAMSPAEAMRLYSEYLARPRPPD